ncbi:hypothetical protein RRG08_064363 [Elysia crispata]|uniref:Uncharacterized protein n=1 Tax=Elysia crispata TaxID=231223 RepID=A0AAE0ZRQ8_9GAST|nr:hypothetical protein RRG08_064363 [Elysia crispata]
MISMIVLDTSTGCIQHSLKIFTIMISLNCLGHKHGPHSTAQDFHNHDQYDCLVHKHGLRSIAQDFHNHDQYDCLGHANGFIQQPKTFTIMISMIVLFTSTGFIPTAQDFHDHD